MSEEPTTATSTGPPQLNTVGVKPDQRTRTRSLPRLPAFSRVTEPRSPVVQSSGCQTGGPGTVTPPAACARGTVPRPPGSTARVTATAQARVAAANTVAHRRRAELPGLRSLMGCPFDVPITAVLNRTRPVETPVFPHVDMTVDDHSDV